MPYGADQTVYLVVDRFREASVYRDFNTLEHWSDDLSRQVAAEIQTRCDMEGAVVPEHVRDFVRSYTDPAPSA